MRAGRDLVLLAAGQAVSVAGDSAALVALLLRLRPDGSGWVAGLLAAELASFIVCAPLSGRVVDRVETHRVLLVALIGQALVAVPLALVAAPWATVALFAVLNGLSTLVRPATSALVPAAVGPDEAARGYTRLATGASLGWIAGPALGGLVTTRAGRGSPSRQRPGRVRAAVAVPCAASGAAGQRRRHRMRRRRQCGGTISLHRPARHRRLSLLGVRVLPRLREHVHVGALRIGNLITGLGIAGIGLAPTVTVALIASAAGGFGNGLVNVTENALIAVTPQAPSTAAPSPPPGPRCRRQSELERRSPPRSSTHSAPGARWPPPEGSLQLSPSPDTSPAVCRSRR